MKTRLIIAIVLLLTCMAGAKTDIFGDGREITLTYGEDVAQIHAGFMPFEDQDLSWGLVVTSLLSDAEVDENLHVDSWMAGMYLEYPILDIGSIDPIPAINSELFAGVELQYAFEKDHDVVEHDDIYFTPYLGWEVTMSKNLSARVRVAYNRRDDILDEYVLTGGVAIRW